MKSRSLRFAISVFILTLVSLACGLFGSDDALQLTPTQLSEAEAQPTELTDVEEPAMPVDLPEETSGPENSEQLAEFEVPLGEKYHSLEGGFAFRTLLDYELEEFSGFATMLAPDGNIDSGPAIVMIGEVTDKEPTLDEFFDAQMSEIPTDVEFSTPQDVMVGGKPGWSIVLNGTSDDGIDITGKMTLALAGPKRTWIFLGVSPAEQWENFAPLVDAVEASVTFFEPQIRTGDLDVPAVENEALGDEFTSVDGGYTFRVVDGFEVDEIKGNTYMAGPNSDPDTGPMIAMIGETLDEEVMLDELYEAQISEISPDDLELSAPRDDVVGGAQGRTVDISGTTNTGISVAGEVTIVLVNPKQMFMIGGLAPAEQWDEFAVIYEAVKSSVSFGRPAGDEIRQWAQFAFASSSYDDPDWHAVRATGAPDVPTGECIDHQNAWASEGSDTVEWLELFYVTPVIPTEINILQTHSPDQVVKVELVDMGGAYREIYTGVPENLWDECPYTLSIPVDVDYGVKGLKITIDQSVIPTTWNEIDAVELVGVELEEGAFAPPKDDDQPAIAPGELTLQDSPVPSSEAGQVNQRLLELGYQICSPTDFFSIQTQGAVKEFQLINGLEVNGIVNSETWNLLFDEAALPADNSVQELTFSEPLEGVTGDKLASSGTLLWVLSRGFNFLEAYDTNTGELAGIFSVEALPGEENYTPQAIAYDKEWLWIASLGDGDAILQAYDPGVDPVEGILTPQLSESIHLEDIISIRGLSYDGKRVWIAFESTTYPSGLAEISSLTENVVQVFEFGLDEFVSAPAFDMENLWVAFEGVVMGDAILAVDPDSGVVGDASGFCGYQVAHDLAALWVAKEYEVLAVHPYGDGAIYGRAVFENRIKDITFSGARIYLLFEDNSVRFFQVY